MTAFIDAIELPPGLYWDDEFQWAAIRQTITETNTGIFAENTSVIGMAGRPITLTGGEPVARISRQALLTLTAYLAQPDETYVLNWHGVLYDVIAVFDPVPVDATPFPVVRDKPLAGIPPSGSWYWLNSIKLRAI